MPIRQVTNDGDWRIDGSNRILWRTQDNRLWLVGLRTSARTLNVLESANGFQSLTVTHSTGFATGETYTYASSALGRNGKIYIVYYSVGGTNQGLFMDVFDTATGTFSGRTYLSSGITVNSSAAFLGTACCIDEDDSHLHIAWKHARSTGGMFGLLIESQSYTRVQLSDNTSTHVTLTSLGPLDIILEKTNSSHRPIILAASVSTGGPAGTPSQVDLLYGNQELATSFTRQANVFTILRATNQTCNLVEDNNGDHYAVYADGAPNTSSDPLNLEYMKHTGTDWSTGYTNANITSVGTEYTYAATGSWGAGSLRDDKHFLAVQSSVGVGSLYLADDYNVHTADQWNALSQTDSASTCRNPRIRWSQWNHIAPNILEWVYNKSGDLYYDRRDLNF